MSTPKPFLRLCTSDEAWAALATVTPLGTETVAARGALGRVLAEAVTAREDVPHFFRSNMDGFAVRAADTAEAGDEGTVALQLVGEVRMGEEAVQRLDAGCAIRVSTGAMMPPGADAVVMVEHTEEAGAVVRVHRAVARGNNTIAVAEDLKQGEMVLPAGHRLRGSDVGVVTGAGRATVVVHRVPRVGVAATGDEIVEPEDDLPPGRVRNVNQYLLASMARAQGAHVVDYGVVRDDPAALDRLFADAARDCDVLLLSGGSSKGTGDLVKDALGRLGDVHVHFHGIAIAPGKPTMFAQAGGLSILGVPGNPAAAAVVFVLFGSVLLRLREGESAARIHATRPRVRAVLAERVASTPGREDWIRVRLVEGGAADAASVSGAGVAGGGGVAGVTGAAAVSGAAIVGAGGVSAAGAAVTLSGSGAGARGLAALPLAVPLRGKSVAISTIARADGLLRIPRSSEGLDAGTEAEVWLLP